MSQFSLERHYGMLGASLKDAADNIRNGATNLDELKKVYHDANCGIIDANNNQATFSEGTLFEVLETVKSFFVNNYGLNVNEDWTRVSTLINEWNEHVAPIFGVKCNTFDEFAIQAATVSSQWAKYKSSEAMQQQPVQPQQNQMFVDVNTLISENNYLKSLNTSKDEEIKALKARLVALGQPV